MQLVLHAFLVASHRKLPQLAVAPAGQAPPAPSHIATFVSVFVPAGQLAARHTVVAGQNWHAPAPLHRPLVPQLEGSLAAHPPFVSATPAGTGEHVPSEPGSAHVWHRPSHGVSQQTPSTQDRPVLQSDAAEQVPPRGF